MATLVILKILMLVSSIFILIFDFINMTLFIRNSRFKKVHSIHPHSTPATQGTDSVVGVPTTSLYHNKYSSVLSNDENRQDASDEMEKHPEKPPAHELT